MSLRPGEAETPSDRGRSPAEFSRVRGRPAFAARRLPVTPPFLVQPYLATRYRELCPNPIRSDTSCREIAAATGGDSRWRLRGCLVPDPLGNSTVDDLTRTSPTPAKGGTRGPATTCLREGAGRGLRPRSSRDDRNGATTRMHRLRGRIRGQGPHHPLYREEERDLPHPRCLSSMSRRNVYRVRRGRSHAY